MVIKHLIVCSMIGCSLCGCAEGIRDDGSTVRKIIDGFEGEPVVPRNANRLFIAPLLNKTGIDDLAPLLLNKVKENISLDGRLGIESVDSNSDLLLEIRITRYLIERQKYDEIGRAVSKRIWITADVMLTNIKRKKVIFFETDIQSFRVFSELVYPIETEARAREQVLEDLAKRITAKTVTGWYTDQMTIIEKRKL